MAIVLILMVLASSTAFAQEIGAALLLASTHIVLFIAGVIVIILLKQKLITKISLITVLLVSMFVVWFFSTGFGPDILVEIVLLSILPLLPPIIVYLLVRLLEHIWFQVKRSRKYSAQKGRRIRSKPRSSQLRR